VNLYTTTRSDPAGRRGLSLARRAAIFWSVPALAQIANFLYPPRCAACGVRFAIECSARVCARCLGRLEPLPAPLCRRCGGPLESAVSGAGECARCVRTPPHYRRARSVARYRVAAEDDPESLPALIRRHKYGLDQSMGRALAEFLPAALPVDAAEIDVVIPVPLHRRRLWWRGFNQAAILAAEIARRLGAPLDTAALYRTRATRPQTARDHDDRVRNVRGAFAAHAPARVAGRRVLLVDDVMTTGATADECARALMRAGAASVDVFTLARVL
jgi:ComF family protein